MRPDEAAMARDRRNRPPHRPETQAVRRVRLPPDANEMMKAQLEAFRKKFGRDPGPGDPVLFDPDAPGPDPVPHDESKMIAETVITMIRAEIPQRFIYTFLRTDGLIADERGYRRLSPEDRRLWDLAMREYDEIFGDK